MKNERISRRNLIQLLLYSTLIFVSSCSGDDDNDSTALGLDDMLSSEYQDEINKHVPLNKGRNPPNIEGTYYMNTPVIIFDSDNDKELDTDYAIISIKSQSSANTVSFEMKEFNNDEGLLYVTPFDLCYISGSGSQFTLCFKYYEEYKDANCTAIIAISGTKTSLGISELCCVAIIIDKNDPDDDYFLDEVGHIRIMAEKDGLASNYSSTSASAKAINMIRERNSFLKKTFIN